jgi:hypothetical protein
LCPRTLFEVPNSRILTKVVVDHLAEIEVATATGPRASADPHANIPLRAGLTAPFWPQIVPYNKRVIHCRTGGLTMHTIILAIVIALAGLVMIASGALQLSMLEAAEGEMLQMSDSER